MSAATAEKTQEKISAEVEMAVGDSEAVAKTPATDALKWFVIVEIPQIDFKAFCRMPNDFQHKDIREKALAAKARRMRALKNPSTDAYEVFEDEMETIAENPQAKESLIAEILSTDFFSDRQEAIDEVREREEFQTVHQDQERYRELELMDADERPSDEWIELLQHLAAYSDAIDEEIKVRIKPREEALEALDLDVLLDRVRRNRMEAQAKRAFMDTYTFWQVLAGTLRMPDSFDPEHPTEEALPRQRYFEDEKALREADPMVVAQLQSVFVALEANLSLLTSGNS